MDTYTVDIQPENTQFVPKGIDTVAAIICFLCGFLLINLMQYDIGLGMTLYCLAFVALTMIYVKKKLGKLNSSAWVGALLIAVYSLSFTLFDNGSIKFFGVAFICLFVPYWYFRIFSCREGAKTDAFAGFDLQKSLFYIPFANFARIYPSVFKGAVKRKGSLVFVFVLLGLAIALVPSLIVFSLLSEGDAAFAGLSDMLFSGFLKELSQWVIPLILGVPTAMYIYGALYGCCENSYPQKMNTESLQNASLKLHKLPIAAVCTAMTPLILVYVLFFVSQGAYVYSGFLGILPKEVTVSEYAVSGFFQLLAVSIINALLIFVLRLFAKRNENGFDKGVLRIFTVVFSLFTIGLVCTAVSKMALYVNAFGLTPKRVYATWGMAVIALCFALLIIKQIFPKFNLAKSGVCVCVAMFFALSFANVDGIIAKYNVERYKNGESLDLEMIQYELSGSALPYLAEIYDTADEQTQGKIRHAFVCYDCAHDAKGIESLRSFNFDKYKAQTNPIYQEACNRW